MRDEGALTDQVREIMSTTFGMDEHDIPDDISQDTCPRWTSLEHMTLMVALEEEFGITLSMDDMATMTSLPKIVAVLKRQPTLG